MRVWSKGKASVDRGCRRAVHKKCGRQRTAPSSEPFLSHANLEAGIKLILEMWSNKHNTRNFVWAADIWAILQRFAWPHLRRKTTYRTNSMSDYPKRGWNDHSQCIWQVNLSRRLGCYSMGVIWWIIFHLGVSCSMGAILSHIRR